MSENVLILGAGCSREAGVPLMGDFVERMWELARRKKIGDKKLSDRDVEILERAISIRDELDVYHGRATFDDRNIEDILSILSFNILGGKRGERSKLTDFISAIARTIELSCSVTYSELAIGKGRVEKEGPDVYRDFWIALIEFSSCVLNYLLLLLLTTTWSWNARYFKP